MANQDFLNEINDTENTTNILDRNYQNENNIRSSFENISKIVPIHLKLLSGIPELCFFCQFDRCGHLVEFNGLFVSVWGISSHRRQNEPFR